MVSTWMGDHSSVEGDAVVKNTVTSQEWRNGASQKTPETTKNLLVNTKTTSIPFAVFYGARFIFKQ